MPPQAPRSVPPPDSEEPADAARDLVALTSAAPPARAVRIRVRLLAMVYEVLILAAVLFVATGMFTLAFGDSRQQPLHLILQVYLLSVAGCYFVASWTGGRRTLPMRTWRLHLEDPTGAPPDVRRALVRYVAAVVGLGLGGIAILWALFDRDRQFLHDRIAGTRIVADTPPAPKTG